MQLEDELHGERQRASSQAHALGEEAKRAAAQCVELQRELAARDKEVTRLKVGAGGLARVPAWRYWAGWLPGRLGLEMHRLPPWQICPNGWPLPKVVRTLRNACHAVRDAVPAVVVPHQAGDPQGRPHRHRRHGRRRDELWAPSGAPAPRAGWLAGGVEGGAGGPGAGKPQEQRRQLASLIRAMPLASAVDARGLLNLRVWGGACVVLQELKRCEEAQREAAAHAVAAADAERRGERLAGEVWELEAALEQKQELVAALQVRGMGSQKRWGCQPAERMAEWHACWARTAVAAATRRR